MTYSIIGILAAAIMIVINRDVLWRSGGDTTPTQRHYRHFLLWVLAYYVTDALWGVLDDHKLTALQFADTTVYFITMVAAVLMWTRYVVSYLGDESAFGKALYRTGTVLFAAALVVVVVNLFQPVLFWFDESGAYHAGLARYALLAVQILLFLLTSAYTLSMTSRTEGQVRRRHMTIGAFGIAMMLLVGIQVFFPLWPVYAMGYMLGTCLLHSFVVEDEKEEYRRELESSLQRERLQKQQLEESREALAEALDAAEQANRAKTDFLNNMSHDIRTPMNAIVGFTALATSHLDDEEQARDYLDKIAVSSQHLLSLINDVLDMSRIESGKMTLEDADVHLPDLVHDLRTIVQADATAKGQHLHFDIDGVEHEDIVTDRLRLNQVLLNILSNAIKYTPAGGTIRFRVSEKPSPAPGTALLEFRVKDDGIGMSPEFQETIFEAFTREKTSTVSGIQGTGLGMAITKNIVDMMGGTIAVSSVEGEGSEFVVEIPCRIGSPSATRELAAGDDGGASFEGKRILLAEDNEMNRVIALAILEEAGFTVDVAVDGAQAVAMMEAHDPGHFDAILMDIQMPNMDGYEATRLIRSMENEEKAGIPIIAVTANAFEEDRRVALEAGMDGHLAKPYDVPAIMRTLAETLG